MGKEVPWTDEHIDRVKVLFGDRSDQYAHAILGNARLVNMVEGSILHKFSTEDLLRHMSRLWPVDKNKLMFDEARALELFDLAKRNVDASALLEELKKFGPYCSWLRAANRSS